MVVFELSEKPLEVLESLDGYRDHFMDADLWRPYVQAVYDRHFGGTDVPVRATLPGSFPTFIAGESQGQCRGACRVVKFFGRLFEGGPSYETELQVGRLLAGEGAIPAPALLACGYLFDGSAGWPWPYLVYDYLPGVSLGEVYDQVSPEDKIACARRLGAITRRLHQLPLPGVPLFREGWDGYAALLKEQRRNCAARLGAGGALPPHLLAQVEAYLPAVESLVERRSTPHLIHADLTRDHLLGRLEGGRWTILGLIDYSDAMIGGLPYELVALHLDLFGGDKRLLRAYLDVYGLETAARQELAFNAMCATLLHRFNVDCVRGMLAACPLARQAATLEQVTRLVWDVDVS
jgi:hygromycin-B 7''-O-kinase